MRVKRDRKVPRQRTLKGEGSRGRDVVVEGKVVRDGNGIPVSERDLLEWGRISRLTVEEWTLRSKSERSGLENGLEI